MKKAQKSVRLPSYIKPQRYDITIKSDLKTFTFSGEEKIFLTIDRPTKKIILHAVDLLIDSAIFSAKSHGSLSAVISYDKKNETATFTFPKLLPTGEGKLMIVFTGILNDKMIGFYRSSYQIDGKTHHMATTQFESTHARRAFPCFDEPAHKAVFEVTLQIPADTTVISNTIESDILEHQAGYKIVSFAPTPKMSTYLLAFIVGKFEHIETKTPEGTMVRVFVTPGKKKQATFALEVAAKILSFYHQYFGIPYPLSTLDLIAIPDFASGAMENWGAVTYRETALLVDENQTSTANKQYVTLVIAHELAHQWFGNLVTMEWWTHLWLNEGFASFIEYLAVDHIFPDWHIWTQFVALDHAKALELDSLKNTHPIEVEVHHPDEINEIFDTVSYSKGASIIRMLAEYLGEKDFRLGLQRYLKKHSYANAKTQDLWKALEEVSGKPVRRIMKNWTGKPGYPLVSVKNKDNKLMLSQSRFFQSPKSQRESRDQTVWEIPLSILTATTAPKALMSKSTMTMNNSKGWIKINPKEVGFFRVAYQPEELKLLQQPISKKQLMTEDRYGIVRDAFALCKAGAITTTDVLSLALSYRKEDEYIVWAEIISQLGALANLLFGKSSYEQLKIYNRLVLEKIAKSIDWEKKPNESHSQALLRSIVLYSYGTYGDMGTINKAQEMFADHVAGKHILPSDLRGVVYGLVAENGNEKTYSLLMKLYEKESLQEEKDRLLRGLCLFKDKKLLRQTLEFSFSKHVRSQDAYRAVGAVWHNPYGKYLAWEFVQKKWDIIIKQFGKSHLLPRFIQPAGVFTTGKDAKAVKQFFQEHQALAAKRTIAQAIEQIYIQADWLARDKNKIEQYLQLDLTAKNW